MIAEYKYGNFPEELILKFRKDPENAYVKDPYSVSNFQMHQYHREIENAKFQANIAKYYIRKFLAAFDGGYIKGQGIVFARELPPAHISGLSMARLIINIEEPAQIMWLDKNHELLNHMVGDDKSALRIPRHLDQMALSG